MTNFTGHKSAQIETGIPTNRPSWMDTADYKTVVSGFLTGGSLRGVRTENPASYVANNFTAYTGSGFNEIFYNRILIEPINLKLDNIIKDETKTIKVWNAYFNSRTLQTIVETGTAGLSLVGDKPPPDVIFSTLQERTYTLSINALGAPEVNASYQFNFLEGAESSTVTVTGSRVVMLPFQARNNAVERLEWLTNIIVYRDGTEQRIRNKAHPRQSFTLSFNLQTKHLTSADNLLYGWRKRAWALPTWSEGRIVANVTQGATVINVDTTNADFVAGELAMVWQDFENFDVFSIKTLTDSNIELDRGINATYADAMVAPVKIARLSANPNRLTTGYLGDLSTKYTILSNSNFPKDTPPAEEIYLGVDVYLTGPLLNPDFVEDSYHSEVNVVDYKTGSRAFFSPWTNTKIYREFRIVLDSLEEVWNFKKWLAKREGKLVPFYMPTFENNLNLVLKTGAITSPLVIKSEQHISQGNTRIHIAVKLKDGTWLFRTVTGFSEDGNGDTLAAIDVSLNVDASEIEFISFMGLKRLSSDLIQINWTSNCVAEVTVPIIEIAP